MPDPHASQPQPQPPANNDDNGNGNDHHDQQDHWQDQQQDQQDQQDQQQDGQPPMVPPRLTPFQQSKIAAKVFFTVLGFAALIFEIVRKAQGKHEDTSCFVGIVCPDRLSSPCVAGVKGQFCGGSHQAVIVDGFNAGGIEGW
ncbi:hypothetical protein IAR50_002537 [Cryptococcus sp. DSM 104548]